MLPTLGFILCAYGIYALVRAWTRRYRRRFQPYRQWQRRRRITMVGGAGVGVGIIILIFILGLPSQYNHLKTASIISTSWGHDSFKPGQVMPRQEIMPLTNEDASGLPVYAYLHPETPPAQLLADQKAPSARHGIKHRLRKPVPRSQAYKATAHKAKKSKTSAKHRGKNPPSKKKKAHSSAKKLAANSH
ncbi:MAG: hypothetical protein ACOZF2_08545 [Thermodesulfobacteriota bacterium]